MFENIRRHAMTLHGNVLPGITVSKCTGLDLAGQSVIHYCLFTCVVLKTSNINLASSF